MCARVALTDIAVVVTMLLSAVVPASAQVPADHVRLASDVRNGSERQRDAALRAIIEIPVQQRTQPLLDALLSEVARFAEESERRWQIIEAGGTVEPVENVDLATVMQALVGHEDPAVIPALVSFIGTGNMVMNALTKFGELAVADVVRASNEGRGRASPALKTLTRMLTGPVRYPLSDSSRELLTRIARQRLTGTQSTVVVWSAVELAVATGEPDLITRVQAIAESDDVVRQFGIIEPIYIEATRRRAAAALAGSGR